MVTAFITQGWFKLATAGHHRKDLRRAVVHILSNGGVAPFPTMAGPNVFDSKGDELQKYDESQQTPTVLVYTDSETGTPTISMSTWPLEWRVELVIELALVSDEYQAQTNAELEGRLDDLETQVVNTLFDVTTGSKTANQFRKMYSKIDSYRSIRMGNTQTDHRHAMRGIEVVLVYTSACKGIENVFPDLQTVGILHEIGPNVVVGEADDTDVVTTLDMQT